MGWKMRMKLEKRILKDDWKEVGREDEERACGR